MKISKQKCITLIVDIVAILLLLICDQYTKFLAVTKLQNQRPVSLIKDVLEFYYLENHGAAFGMLQNKKVLFIFMTTVMIVIVLYVLYRLPLEKKYNVWHIFLSLIVAGGIGNMIDRVRLEYVIDFIYFKLINFPVFNVADIYVTCGTILLFIVILFFTKEEELKFLKLQIRKKQPGEME